jgi:hypothetical protein
VVGEGRRDGDDEDGCWLSIETMIVCDAQYPMIDLHVVQYRRRQRCETSPPDEADDGCVGVSDVWTQGRRMRAGVHVDVPRRVVDVSIED